MNRTDRNQQANTNIPLTPEDRDMTEKDIEAIILHVLKRDYAVALSSADLDSFSPGDVGLDSLSQAELYLEVSVQIGISELESPKDSQNFRDIVRHFHHCLST